MAEIKQHQAATFVPCVPRDQIAYEAGLKLALQVVREATAYAGGAAESCLEEVAITLRGHLKTSESWRLATLGIPK